MAPTTLDIQSLSVAERIQLAEDLWDSIATDTAAGVELNAAQRAEVEARLQAHRDDPASAVPWEQVKRELRDDDR